LRSTVWQPIGSASSVGTLSYARRLRGAR